MLLSPKPNSRPSLEKILDHPWFKQKFQVDKSQFVSISIQKYDFWNKLELDQNRNSLNKISLDKRRDIFNELSELDQMELLLSELNQPDNLLNELIQLPNQDDRNPPSKVKQKNEL